MPRMGVVVDEGRGRAGSFAVRSINGKISDCDSLITPTTAVRT